MLNNMIDPRYLPRLFGRGYIDPIFLTCDLDSLVRVHKAKAFCLYCDPTIDAQRFNLTCCYRHEVWVFYTNESLLSASMKLGRAIQHTGAKKVLILPLCTSMEVTL